MIFSPNTSLLQEEKGENVRNTTILQLLGQFSLGILYNKCSLFLHFGNAKGELYTEPDKQIMHITNRSSRLPSRHAANMGHDASNEERGKQDKQRKISAKQGNKTKSIQSRLAILLSALVLGQGGFLGKHALREGEK